MEGKLGSNFKSQSMLVAEKVKAAEVIEPGRWLSILLDSDRFDVQDMRSLIWP